MSVIFSKSAKRLALEKLVNLLVVTVVGAVFGSLFFVVSDLPWPVRTAAVVAVIISIWMFQRIAREITQILKKGEDWRVEITDTKLTWYSPVPEQMQSIELALSQIKATHFIHTRYRNSKRRPRKEYHIETVDGGIVKLDPQLCGINPHRVFKAMEEQGVKFESNVHVEGAKVSIGSDVS